MITHWTICSLCKIAHIDNCHTCLGFGLFENDTIIDAHDAHALCNRSKLLKIVKMHTKPCPDCHSTIDGIPKDLK